MSHFSLQARWVLPVDQPPLEGGVVTIADGRVVAVGTGCSAASRLEDLGDVVLLPGLVNAHTHLEFSQLPQPLGQRGMTLPDWIRLVIADRHRTGRDLAAAIYAGLRESLQHGVTTVGDIATQCHPFSDTDPNVTTFQEAIGFSTARAASVLADMRDRLDNNRDAMSQMRLGVHRRRPTQGISPHAPYTVHPELLTELVDLAVDRQLPVAMHLAESREELQLLATSDGPFRDLLEERGMWDAAAIRAGSTLLDYLKVLSRAPRALVVHGNYLTTDEIRFVAERGERMSIVYCPRTHAYFAHDAYPLQKMLDAGARIALGTDSRASSPDLSLLAEMRFAARQHPEISPAKILEMGTLAGADALSQTANYGSITPGKSSDLIAIACDGRTIDPTEAIVQDDQQVVARWLSGKRIAS